jgi:hypothetical protein
LGIQAIKRERDLDYSVLGVMRTLLLISLAPILAGCARTSNNQSPEYTHVWIDSPQQHVWSHEPLTNGAFIKRRLTVGDVVTLSGGVTISFDGSAMRIRDTVLPTNMLNCVVERDGSIHTNAFIRTFD